MSSLTRPLAGDLLVVSLHDATDTPPAGGRAARTLLKNGPLRSTVVRLAPGGSLAEHQADGPILVQPLEGTITFTARGEPHEVATGQLLTLGAKIPHAVSSTEGATFLVTVVLPVVPPAPPPAAPLAWQKEAWMTGPIEGIPPLLMPVAHALSHVVAEVQEAVAGLSPEEVWTAPAGAASVGYHLRHLAGSTDRLLAYATNRALTQAELAAIASEPVAGDPPATADALVAGVIAAVERVLAVVRATPDTALLDARPVGRARKPADLLGVLSHIAGHAQRHAGQVVTTAKVVRGRATA